jgi:hypothetical protein
MTRVSPLLMDLAEENKWFDIRVRDSVLQYLIKDLSN